MNKPLPPVDVILHHYSYSIITGEFYSKHNKARLKVGDVAGCINNKGRRTIKINNQSYLASRLAWKVVYGVDPQYEIDHIDNNRDNNAIHNLRDVPHNINQLNRYDTKRNGMLWKDNPVRLERNNKRAKDYYHSLTTEQKREYNEKCKERQRQRKKIKGK